MGKIWYVDSNGKRKRTTAGVAHRLRTLPFIAYGVIERPKILRSAFLSVAPAVRVLRVPPRRCFSSLDEDNVLLSRNPISPSKTSGVGRILFGRDKTQVGPAVVESIPVDVVNERPSVFGFSNDIIVDEVALISRVSVIGKVKALSFVKALPDIFINLSKTYKLILVVMKRRLHERFVNDSFREDSFSRNRGKGHGTAVPSSLGLPSLFSGYNFIFIWHKWIISRMTLFQQEEVSRG